MDSLNIARNRRLNFESQIKSLQNDIDNLNNKLSSSPGSSVASYQPIEYSSPGIVFYNYNLDFLIFILLLIYYSAAVKVQLFSNMI